MNETMNPAGSQADERFANGILDYVKIVLSEIMPILLKQHPRAKVDHDQYASLYYTIIYLKNFMLDSMEEPANKETEKLLDMHKTSALAAMAIGVCAPIVYQDSSGQRNKVVGANELLAVRTAAMLLQTYQIRRYCGERGLEHLYIQIFSGIYGTKAHEKILYPEPFTDEHSVESNLTLTFMKHFANQTRDTIKASVWLYSHVYYFLDKLSCDDMEKQATRVRDKFNARGKSGAKLFRHS